MQSINVVLEKQEHDCYSRRKVTEDGTLIVKFICPVCGPYKKFKKFSDGRSKWKLLQTSPFRHSGSSLPRTGNVFLNLGRPPAEWQPIPKKGAGLGQH
jgi:hypothetical protein